MKGGLDSGKLSPSSETPCLGVSLKESKAFFVEPPFSLMLSNDIRSAP